MSKQLHKNFNDEQVKLLLKVMWIKKSSWINHYRLTDELNPQWKQVF